ncbi:hypothetical protein RFI_29315 [Reticulomyxa filosa]|uniref:Uncharacterized protein n=1 Tax=Reticulomyxa filosa TaxID=46433 RepID=X6M2G6_RETFI|nr:hypothetical protein RFI_29315 [Reticulomyxa filosa]|eukprot:ETO08074.1 hypothetical protein RFI_29315 [Reticulomyxa filosa]
MNRILSTQRQRAAWNLREEDSELISLEKRLKAIKRIRELEQKAITFYELEQASDPKEIFRVYEKCNKLLIKDLQEKRKECSHLKLTAAEYNFFSSIRSSKKVSIQNKKKIQQKRQQKYINILIHKRYAAWPILIKFVKITKIIFHAINIKLYPQICSGNLSLKLK